MSVDADRARRIFLTGFSFSGKSRTAPLIAQALGWRSVDLDDLVEQQAGRSVPEIFAAEGETGFRRREREALLSVCQQTDVVVSTGGGIVLAEENRRAMAGGGFVVCLEARPETIYTRLIDPAAEEGSERPLLKAANPLARIRHLKALRQPHYALADFTIHTDNLTPERVASEVVRGFGQLSTKARHVDRFIGNGGVLAGEREADIACWVTTETARYPVYVGWRLLERLGERMRDARLSGKVFVVSDKNVARHYGERVASALHGVGLDVHMFVVPAGESSKDLAVAGQLYQWLAEKRAERGEVVVALGGGMVGDLAGFVAATYLRGMPVVQVPTSLLGMVDASVGGKAAVNLREAKNLVGAFHQPRFVLADTSTLQTLPPRELTSGWAEVIKHALIMDDELLEMLEREAEALPALVPDVTSRVVGRSMALKAQVVSEDERETTGKRSILNYGHTIAHGLEAASEYGSLLHGEAVSVGMAGAAEIGQRLGVTPAAVAERQRALLQRFGLPTSVTGIDIENVLNAIILDKKAAGGAVRWVLLREVGEPVLRSDVPLELAREVIKDLTSGA